MRNKVPIGLLYKSISFTVRSLIDFCVQRSCSANNGAICFTQSSLQNAETPVSEFSSSLSTARRPNDIIRLNAARCTVLLTFVVADDVVSFPSSASAVDRGTYLRVK